MTRKAAVFALLLLTAYTAAAQLFRVNVNAPAQMGRDFSLLVYDGDMTPRILKPKGKKGLVITGAVKGAVYAELRHPKVAMPLPFFIENTDISISYKSDNPETSPITGSRINSELRYQLELSEGDNSSLAEYVRKNPASPIAPYIVDRYISPSADYETVSELYKMLEGEAVKTYHYRQLGQRLKNLEALADGKRMPDFAFTDLKGNTLHLDSILVDGCHNIIVVGATYCRQCKNIEKELYNSFPLVHPVVIDIDQLKEGWDAPFLKQLEIDHIPYLILLDNKRRIVERDLRIWQLQRILQN
ncbi:MAG: hypothetical protein J6T88_00710 [Bacteroidales bacterium]|nr:hypothetical protein [Bacteroidales bacterium]